MKNKMHHKDILIKWLWKYYQENADLGYQCVAWVKKYCQEKGCPIGYFSGSAWKGWTTGSPFDDSWVKFTYKPGMYPKQGDIVFWSEGRCKDGHVAIANKFCNKNVLRCTDQNGKGNKNIIQPRFYNYDFVIGWYSKIG